MNKLNIPPSGHQKIPVLNISELSFGYPGRPPVLENINLKIWPGERVGIIGPNGAGKTTFFMLNCGVIKPISGKVLLYGKPIKTGEFHPELGMIFQNQDDQLFCPSVRDDVAFGPTNMGLDKREVEARVQEAFNTIGIGELAERPPHQLSGGEKRLVALAGVLAMRPRLVIYDEPTSNLDLRFRRKLINILEACDQDAMLIASHDLEFILEVCTRVILLDNGIVVADGMPKDIMGDVSLMNQHGLEKPHSLIPHTENHH
jgi:cobalt/nickel transport system ATP-binding protein